MVIEPHEFNHKNKKKKKEKKRGKMGKLFLVIVLAKSGIFKETILFGMQLSFDMCCTVNCEKSE